MNSGRKIGNWHERAAEMVDAGGTEAAQRAGERAEKHAAGKHAGERADKHAAGKTTAHPDGDGHAGTAHVRVEGTTRVVGILGDPVDHSLSPRMHNAAYAALGLDFVYVPFRAPRKRLAEAVQSLGSLGVAGLNVTVPYKEEAAKLVDRLTDSAKAIGAVNTIYREDGRIIGDNTDAEGFHQALVLNDFRVRGKRVLMIGAGGSARAVLYALVRHGAADIVVANRTVAKAKKLARLFSGVRGAIRVADLDILDNFDFLPSRHLVVNCTPVGLKGGAFLDYSVENTPADCLHFDLAYREELTPFLKAARKAGRPVLDGRHMLVQQGALAFRHFTGRRAPLDVMLKAVGL